MTNKAVLLVYNSGFLQEVFSRKEFSDDFKIIFSSPENFEFYRSNFKDKVVFLILDETFAKDKKIRILMSFDTPVIFVSDKLTEKEVIRIYKTEVDDVIQDVSNTEVLLCKLKNILHKYLTISNVYKDLKRKTLEDAKKTIEIDSKSGLYTADFFNEKAEEILRNNPDTEFTLVQMDMDRFKVFNDLYGFKTGDLLLKNIGNEMKKLFSANPLIVCTRVRAEHFVMLLEKDLYAPETIVKYASEFFENLYPGFYFNVRLGIYDIPENTIDINICVENSLLALISIKGDYTRHYAYYMPEMSRVLFEEQELISDMVMALEKDEFKVWLQPQYDYVSNSLTGAEALVRWKHPVKGLIPPVKFIPVFERNGFITQLDEFVWNKVCSLVRKWIDMGLNPVPVSVNISRRDIYNINVPKTFRELLKKYNLTPNYIRLEITESAYMETPQKLINIVSELQSLGFTVEMDDFGSGYSSLNTLKDVPVDVLKLDMKFIMDENVTEKITEKFMSKGGSILSSIVRMANWLNLPVIAEGIETKAQAEYLKSIGCFIMQGYYFAKPMPHEDFEMLLKRLPDDELKKKKASDKLSSAVNFLDASIQSTLLFNSYVGGAAIIEWDGNVVEAIRINDQFFDEIETSRETFEEYRRNLLNGIEASSRSVFLANLAETVRLGRPTFCEIKLNPLHDGQRPFWIRVRLRHLAKNLSSDIFYLAIDNVDFRMHLLELNTTISEQLAGIIETVPCGIESLVYDKSTKELKLSYINERCASIFGYNQSEFRVQLGKDPLFIFKESDKRVRIKYFEDVVESGRREFSVEVTVVMKDGSNKNLSIYGKLTDRTDGKYNVTVVYIDDDLEKFSFR